MKKIKMILKKVFWYFILPVLCATVLRVFFFELYKIPSSSMEPSLIPGDFIIVNKMSYGARLIKFGKLHREKKLGYTRAPGWGKIKKGDVFVFNWPQYFTLNDSIPNMYGDFIVKRCYGLPGDTIRIKNDRIIDTSEKQNLFPHDTALHWTVDNYGPLWVPGRNLSLTLNPVNALHYIDVIRYEGYKVAIKGDSVFLNGHYANRITFKHNYYFMKGDNFYNSSDSRFWGFVPEENIIGKVACILYSYGSKKDYKTGIRWNRILGSLTGK
jgi:signal peptidase I